MNNPLIAFEDKSINPLPLKGNLQMSNMIDINEKLDDFMELMKDKFDSFKEEL